MQIDPNALKALLSHSDEGLWELIRRLAKANGIAVSDTPPAAADMKRLREVLTGATDMDADKALALLAKYRREGKL